MPFSYYRDCWHEIGQGFFSSYVIISTGERVLQPIKNESNLFCLPHSRNITRSSVCLLSKIPHCWLKIKPGPCLSSSVANRPLRLTKHLWLGKLLPYQQPNTPRAHNKLVYTFFRILVDPKALLICTIAFGFIADSHVLLTCTPCCFLTFN